MALEKLSRGQQHRGAQDRGLLLLAIESHSRMHGHSLVNDR